MVKRFDELMQDPEREFRDPQRLLEDQDLSDEQKIRLFMNWRLDLLELERATEENMAGTDEAGKVADKLARVNAALDELGAKPSEGSPL